MTLPRIRCALSTFLLLPLLAAFTGWLYVRAIRLEAARIGFVGNPPVVPLDITVLDADTGQPVPNAKVELPFLHPSWRGRPEMKDGDLRKEHGHTDWRPSPLTTDGGGGTRTAMKAQKKGSIEYRLLGLLPVAGPPRMIFGPVIGLRVEADGYETWTRFLDDITPDDGRRQSNLVPMPITVRLKPVDGRASP
jgi:hypothetical protein